MWRWPVMPSPPDHRAAGVVAVILAATVGLGLLFTLVMLLGPWGESDLTIVVEVLAILALISGALVAWVSGQPRGGGDDGPSDEPG